MSKTSKLWVHRSSATEQRELMISGKDFPQLKVNDIVEIYHPEEEFSRLLLQIESFSDDFQQKDTISLVENIATTFQLRAYKDVIVSKIDPQTVCLDMVELIFKEQYFHRSDMWRLIGTLKSLCVYLNKKIEFAEMRCTVNEMWSRGEKVTCGVITDETRVVFRSCTAVVQIFIQMSCEMWEFDLNGDLYFEKAVNGFLADLFTKWREQNCCHDVTIVFFSRTFYDSQSLDDFPPEIRDCLQMDDLGNIYEDFYRVIVQNERYEEWLPTLGLLRQLFVQYRDYVLHYHQNQWPNWTIPSAHISTAAKGNFLETLNMSLNLFENYYVDRNFDRTGKVSVVITPGPGVFEVDRELTFITKQRTIDCGVGSDLVCMGEQPLHAVPLFKFRSKNIRSSVEVGDDYNIPHWMNHSFYTSTKQLMNQQTSAFVPRIKPPPSFMKVMQNPQKKIDLACHRHQESDSFPFVDYDEYDAFVFKLASRTIQRSLRSSSCYGLKAANGTKRMPHTIAEARRLCAPHTRYIPDEVLSLHSSADKKPKMSSTAIAIPSPPHVNHEVCSSVGCYPIIEKTVSRDSLESSGSNDEGQYYRPVVGSAGSPVGHSRCVSGIHPQRALINPFAPSRLQFRMTSNRRRWVHALPTDAKGLTVQPHHIQVASSGISQEAEEYTWSSPTPQVVQAAQLAVEARRQKSLSLEAGIEHEGDSGIFTPDVKSTSNTLNKSTSGDLAPAMHKSVSSAARQSNSIMKEKYVSCAANGDQEWMPDLTTGVDWKSLTIPASLPITTDYFPEDKNLTHDYVIADYNLLPDDVNSEYWMRPPDDKNLSFYRRSPLTTHEVFKELISQRLGQGFQLIVRKSITNIENSQSSSTSGGNKQYKPPRIIRTRHHSEPEEEYYLSIGRIFHVLKLKGPTITVVRYWPRHPQPQRRLTYRYRFQAPDSRCYDASSTEFSNELLENYNWSYLDQYICTRGESDYGLIESLKYWRSRFFLLPQVHPSTKHTLDGKSNRFDIYEERSPSDMKEFIKGFVRFVENLNKVKKVSRSRRSKTSAVIGDIEGNSVRTEDGKEKEEKLTAASPLTKIYDAMLDPQSGVNIVQSVGLPGNCFISAEAVLWVQQHVGGAQGWPTAMKVMKALLDDGLILHASGNTKHKFIFGFYLYYFSKVKAEPHVVQPGSSFNTLFQNEWMEVSIVQPASTHDVVPGREMLGGKFFLPQSNYSPEREASSDSSFPQPDIIINEDWREQTGWSKFGWGQLSGKTNVCDKNATLVHKYVNVDVNQNKKSDRQEWATACYNAYYSPLCAFEIQLQWMVATGTVLADLIYTWARKAGTCGFHLIPVPHDPFALPELMQSDPLRGPIFIPLSIRLDDTIFNDCNEDQKQARLLRVQDCILKRFGFVPCGLAHTEKSGSQQAGSDWDDYKHQYVHSTVGMFVLIPELKPPCPPPPANSKPVPVFKSHRSGLFRHPPSPTAGYLAKRSSSDLHKDYIARQHSNLRCEESNSSMQPRVGFLWSWNFMSTRRWHSNYTDYEDFQDQLLTDFTNFCAGEVDQRLEHLLQELTPL